MVLNRRDEDFITGLYKGFAEGIGDHVYGFGRASCEDDFVRCRCIEEGPGFFPYRGVCLRAVFGQLIDGAVDSAIVVAIEAIHGFDHLERLLRCRTGIKIDQRLSKLMVLANMGNHCE